jgi:hypothetical protein
MVDEGSLFGWGAKFDTVQKAVRWFDKFSCLACPRYSHLRLDFDLLIPKPAF